MLLLLNGIGIIGRLVPNYLADRYGAINVFVPTAIIAGICQLTWIAVASPGGLYAWTVFYGIAAGGIQVRRTGTEAKWEKKKNQKRTQTNH